MGKHAKPEEIVAKLREFEVLTAQGKSTAEAARSISVSEQTCYRWRADYGSMKMDQLKRLKELETENARLRRAVTAQRCKEAVPGSSQTLETSACRHLLRQRGRTGLRQQLPLVRLQQADTD